LHGDLLKDSVNYAVGVFNGSADLASSNGQDVDNNNDKDVAGRIFVHPFKSEGPEALKGLGVGVGGSYGHKEGATLPTYRSAGQASIFSYSAGTSADGSHVRVSPQAYFYKGSLGLLSEYAVSKQELVRAGIRESFTNKGWQISGNYVLTGEAASFKGITPRTNFDLEKGTWGAFEIVSRYGHLNTDNKIFDLGFASSAASVTEADEWGAGLNWYPHKNIRLALDFEQTHFNGGAAPGLDRKTENAILSRFQLSY
jgi:phosphate-selective porin OprO and OprP